MFQGSYVALVTPFKDDESLDEAKLKELIQFQLDGGRTASSRVAQPVNRLRCPRLNTIALLRLQLRLLMERCQLSRVPVPTQRRGRCVQHSTPKPPVRTLH